MTSRSFCGRRGVGWRVNAGDRERACSRGPLRCGGGPGGCSPRRCRATPP